LKKISKGLGGLTCSKKLYMWECEVWEEIPYGVSMLVALEELAFDGSESLKMNLEGLRKSSKED